jgi:hypothetical protein
MVLCLLPYSGKISLVQNFAELHVSASEEIFVVLFSRLLMLRPHPRRSFACRTSNVFSAHLRFRGSYFCGTQPIRKKREILHHATYTVC